MAHTKLIRLSKQMVQWYFELATKSSRIFLYSHLSKTKVTIWYGIFNVLVPQNIKNMHTVHDKIRLNNHHHHHHHHHHPSSSSFIIIIIIIIIILHRPAAQSPSTVGVATASSHLFPSALRSDVCVFLDPTRWYLELGFPCDPIGSCISMLPPIMWHKSYAFVTSLSYKEGCLKILD